MQQSVLKLLVCASLALASSASSVFSSTPEEYGAIGDGKADDTNAIAKALDACSSQTLPCDITFAKSYLSGPIVLARSAVTLSVTGALSMLPRRQYTEYCDGTGCPGSFISNSAAEPCTTVPTVAGDYPVCMSDVTITGGGVISAATPWGWWPCKYLDCWRPHLIILDNVHRVAIHDITLKDSPNHFIELVECVASRVYGVTMNAPYISPNTDGINFYGGFDSVLRDTLIDNGDDCVSVVPINEFADYCVSPEETDIRCSGGHVVVSNVTCNGGHGLSIGGVRHGSVRNVTFEDITATGGQTGSTQDEAAGGGCRVKSYPNSTGVVRDIRYRNIRFDDVYLPIQLLGHYCPWPCNTPDGDSAVTFRDISFHNIQGSGKQRNTVVEFKCSEFAPCENITMEGVNLVARGGVEGLMTCENVNDLSIDEESLPSKCQ
jgi:polygalacturonase